MQIPDKRLVHQVCVDHLRTQIAASKEEINALRESAAEETKSSAGDKYETSREMIQAEMVNLHGHLDEQQKMLTALLSIDPAKSSATIGRGSLVMSNQGIFFLAASLGQIMVEGTRLYVISMGSPMGQALDGRKAGEHIELNGRRIEIETVK